MKVDQLHRVLPVLTLSMLPPSISGGGVSIAATFIMRLPAAIVPQLSMVILV